MKNLFEITYADYGLGEDHFVTMYRPVPADEVLPDWYKSLENKIVDKNVRSCRGVYDVMTMGYIFLWNIDVIISKDENGKLFIRKARDLSQHDFHPHPIEQLGLYPDINMSMQREGVQKLLTPYQIKTPKGTSIMMVQPMYRPDLRTEIVPGVVDTDSYYTGFNILFTIKDIGNRKDVRINAGTPLAQVIPFKRTEWEIGYAPMDEDLKRKIDTNSENIDSVYAKQYWSRKFFKRKVK